MKRIRLENFRCYTDQSIEFKSGINLLVGDNGSGKTSILKACKYVLSSFFAGFSDEHTKLGYDSEKGYSVNEVVTSYLNKKFNGR